MSIVVVDFLVCNVLKIIIYLSREKLIYSLGKSEKCKIINVWLIRKLYAIDIKSILDKILFYPKIFDSRMCSLEIRIYSFFPFFSFFVSFNSHFLGAMAITRFSIILWKIQCHRMVMKSRIRMKRPIRKWAISRSDPAWFCRWQIEIGARETRWLVCAYGDIW